MFTSFIHFFSTSLTPSFFLTSFLSLFTSGLHAVHADCCTDLHCDPCLSVSPIAVLCLNQWTHRHTFWRSARDIILVIWALQPLQYSKLNPQRGAKYTKGSKLGKYCHLSRKWYQIGSQWLWNTNRKSLAADRSVSILVIWMILKGGTSGIEILRLIYIITLENFDLELPYLAWVEVK